MRTVFISGGVIGIYNAEVKRFDDEAVMIDGCSSVLLCCNGKGRLGEMISNYILTL
jgi:hypothetical protein